RRAAGRVSLAEVELGLGRVARLAVGELARKGSAVERPFPPSQLTGLSRRLTRVSRCNRLLDHLAGGGRVLLEELGELRVHGLLDEAAHPRVPEFCLRLPLKSEERR